MNILKWSAGRIRSLASDPSTGIAGDVYYNTGTGLLRLYNGSWSNIDAGTGTVTSVSIVSANGLAGTVATSTTTPAITLSTTITGILKGNGTAISAAVAGTDYQAPITFGTGVQTALGVNVGSAGAPVVNGGTLGTPSSGTLTNTTGLPEAGLTLADNTTNDASATKHGFLPKLTNTGAKFLRDDGTYQTVSAGANTALSNLASTAVNTTIGWPTGLGGITHIQGPSDQTFIIRGSSGRTTYLTGETVRIQVALSTTPAEWIFSNRIDFANDYYLQPAGNPIAYLLGSGTPTINLKSTGLFGFSPSSSDPATATDTALARNAAGVVEVNNGTAGTFRDLIARTHSIGATVSGTNPGITVGSGTGVTVNATGELTRVTYKVTVTFAALAATGLTADKVIATLPAKTRLVSIITDTTTPYTGGGVTAATLIVGKTTGGNEYIVSHDVLSAAIVKGLADADLGTSINRANAVQGGDLPSWTTTTNISVRLTTVTANTDQLTAGSTTYYLVTEKMP